MAFRRVDSVYVRSTQEISRPPMCVRTGKQFYKETSASAAACEWRTHNGRRFEVTTVSGSQQTAGWAVCYRATTQKQILKATELKESPVVPHENHGGDEGYLHERID